MIPYLFNERLTIDFDSNDGTPTPPSQTVVVSFRVIKPQDPVKPGYIFAGWFMDDGIFLYKWDFKSEPHFSFTLYAKWVESGVGPPAPPAPSYTVTFDSGNRQRHIEPTAQDFIGAFAGVGARGK